MVPCTQSIRGCLNCLAVIVLLLSTSHCHRDDADSVPAGSCSPIAGRNLRADMRTLVCRISQYAKAQAPNFAVIAQNGQELATDDGTATGKPMLAYLKAIDAQAREDLIYGYSGDDVLTEARAVAEAEGVLDLQKNSGVNILAINYCSTPSKMADAINQCAAKGYVSYSAPHRVLDLVPAASAPLFAVNNASVQKIAQMKNFFYLLSLQNFTQRQDALTAMGATDHDGIVMDAFFNDGTPWTAAEVTQLKQKAHGGTRLVFAYMSIGEAENYRSYWQKGWQPGTPCFVAGLNPKWPGNFKVHYWEPQWQKLLFGDPTAYLDKILAAGFDGVYLDIIDAFEYFEGSSP
jgi:cysteinyl-tRNA synthetase